MIVAQPTMNHPMAGHANGRVYNVAMLEIAAFTGALSSLGALIKIANESKNVSMTDKLIDLQQKIITMQDDFGEMQQKFFELQQQNRELTESVASKTRYEHLGVRRARGVRGRGRAWAWRQ